MLLTRRLVLALALIASSVARAYAQGGINLAWNDCLGQPNAAANVEYACDGSRNGNPFSLVASFLAPADLSAFVAIQMVFSIETMFASEGPHLAPMTDWWRLGVGECRYGNLAFPASMAGIGTGTTGSCQNPFLGAVTGGGYRYTYPYPDAVRLETAFARDSPIALTNGQHYLAGVITLDTFGDVPAEGVAVCAGCCERRAIILYQMELYQEPGQVPPQQDLYVLTTSATRQYVMWQDHENCATPTRRATWGSIKAAYR